MVTTFIPGKACIAGVYDRFPVNHNGWEIRAARWISTGLRLLDVPLLMASSTEEATLVEYKCNIPDKTAYIRGVSWKGLRVNRLGVRINADVIEDIPNLAESTYWYNIDANGYITSNLENEDIKIYIYKYIDDLDEDANAYYPRIPDDVEAIEALEWYILKRLLERGHKVEGYSLTSPNEFINPGLAWEKARKKARNSLNSFDSETRELISRLKRSFIIDYNAYTQSDFNPYLNEA